MSCLHIAPTSGLVRCGEGADIYFGMTPSHDDAELLRQYVEEGSRQALGERAVRYSGLVYSAAKRQVRDAHLAEDVSQAVFILLAKKANQIRDPSMLVGWLYQ